MVIGQRILSIPWAIENVPQGAAKAWEHGDSRRSVYFENGGAAGVISVFFGYRGKLRMNTIADILHLGAAITAMAAARY